ncbi:cytochrome c3 family protein [Neobacillus rhizosphaerae]|uniref:cytochrome c3 family protein n=1 Tax=Neobacillus rhizosphaerae TaxID=2880965 RepID=UPI003D2C1518
MKRMNYKRKLISYIVTWSVFISSLLLYSPDNIAHSASGVPEIKITTPADGAVLDVSTVEFIGRVTDDLTTPDKLQIKVFEQLSDTQQPIDITDDGKLSITQQDTYADFSFSKEFSQGNHTLTFVVTDDNGVSNKSDLSFTVMMVGTEQIAPSVNATDNSIQSTTVGTDSSQPAADVIGKRPYMAKMFLVPKESVDDYQPGEAVPSSFLPAEDMTRVPIDYKIFIDVRSTEPLATTQPLITFFGDITGTEKLVKTTKVTDGTNAYIYTFTPDKQLVAGTTYYVYLNPNFENSTGDQIIPRFLKFTTRANYENYQFAADKGNDVREHDYIHGPFSIVTNTCSFCHSTHNGNNEFLESGKNGTDGDDLCMACHDGTNGSPSLDTNYATNKHHKDSGASCSTCHDPHNPGTKENPNSLYKGTYDGIPQLLTYKKASDSTGVSGDFSLCLSCHNGGKATNIEQYYKNDTLVSQSGHNMVATVDSGSSLNGQLPCAECHETHGSKNIKMIRENLGNVQSANSFSKTSGDWDSTAERQFCLSCHNDKTVLYGITGKAIFDETGTAINTTNEQTKTGHNKQNSQACSECHSNNKSFIEAAHAPKKIINP